MVVHVGRKLKIQCVAVGGTNSPPQRSLCVCNLHLLLEVCILILRYFLTTKITKGTANVWRVGWAPHDSGSLESLSRGPGCTSNSKRSNIIIIWLYIPLIYQITKLKSIHTETKILKFSFLFKQMS